VRVGYMVAYSLLEYGIAEVTRLDGGELVPVCHCIYDWQLELR